MDSKAKSFRVRVRYVLVGILFILLLCGLFLLVTKKPQGVQAQKAMFYPESCLGGWQQSKNATGVPEALDSKYTLENSAVYTDNEADIFCGEFSGELPPQTYHTRVTLRFSWQQQLVAPSVLEEGTGFVEALVEMFVHDNESTETAIDTEQEVASSTITTEATSTTELATSTEETSVTASSTDFEISSSTAAEMSSDQTVVSGGEGDTSETTQGVVTTEEASATSTSETVSNPASEQSIPLESIPEPEPTLVPESQPEPTPEGETVWYQNFIKLAHAEEIVAELATSTVAVATATVEVVEGTEMSVLAVEPSVVSVESTDTDALFAVEYTLDGVLWQHIGFVSSIDNDVRFELPKEAMATLSDITNIQIALRPLARFDQVSTIYLDAMWLEVSYAPVRELGVHVISTIVPEVVSFNDLFVTATSSLGVVASASTTITTRTVSDFANNLIFVHGIDERFATVGIKNATATELWLFDLVKEEIYRIGFGEAQIGNYPIAAKDRMIFWLNYDGSVLYTYDLRTAGRLHEMALVLNLPNAEETRLTFPFTDWQVVWRADQFYFFKDSAGEVFQDENTGAAEKLFIQFRIPTYLDQEQLHAIGGIYLPLDALGIIDTLIVDASSTDPVIATSTSTSTNSEILE